VREARIHRVHQRVVVGADVERVAIGGQALEGGRPHRAAGAIRILDHDRLAEQRRHRIRHDATHDVGGTGDRHGDDQPDGAVGVAVLRGKWRGVQRPGEERCGEKLAAAHGQVPEAVARGQQSACQQGITPRRAHPPQ